MLNLTQLPEVDMSKRLLKTFFILFAVLCSHANAQSAPHDHGNADRLYAEGRFSDALAAYERLLAAPSGKAGSGDIHSRIGDCYFRLHNYQRALSAYRSALQNQKYTERPPTQYWIGFCSFLLGNDKEAVSEFLKIPEHYPSSGMWVGTAYYWAGRASERMGDKAAAAEYYRKAGGKGKSTQERFAMKKAEAVKSK